MNKKISIVFMRFPSPRETFACLEMKQLNSMGVNLDIQSIYPSKPATERLIEERGLSNLTMSFGALADYLTCFFRIVINLQLLSVLILVLWQLRMNIKELLKTAILFPLLISCAYRIKKNDASIAHYYWGHYPAVVSLLLAKIAPQIHHTFFLGAYDLTLAYPISATAVNMHGKCVFTHCHFNEELIKNLGVKKDIFVVYRGTVLPKVVNSIEKNIDYLSVGQLIPEKGMEKVVKVFARRYAKNNKLKCHILGEGEEKSKLLNLATELGCINGVVFEGHVSHNRVLECMRSAKVLLFFSRKISERLPNVVKEAMISECVCVVSCTPAIDELVLEGKTGFIVDPDDVESVDQLLEQISRSDNLNLLQSAKSHVEDNFDVSKTVNVYVNQWQKLNL